MVYSKGDKFIAIELNDLLGGKKPGLYIGEGMTLIKVASFSTFEKANIFEEYLRCFFGEMLVVDDQAENAEKTREGIPPIKK